MVAVPDRSSGSLGAALTNTRTPVTNEFSAVNLEKIKDALIAQAIAINTVIGDDGLGQVLNIYGQEVHIRADGGGSIFLHEETDFCAQQAINLADPTGDTSAATKGYTDRGGLHTRTVADIVTADATPTNALLITGLPDDHNYRVRVTVVIGKGAFKTAYSGHKFFTCNVSGGVAGAGAGYGGDNDFPAAESFDIVASGANLQIRVIGIAATSIRWQVMANVEIGVGYT